MFVCPIDSKVFKFPEISLLLTQSTEYKKTKVDIATSQPSMQLSRK